MLNPRNKNSAFFPVCEYRARFGDYHDMQDPKHWNAYARSVDKRHPSTVKQYQFTFLQSAGQTTELAKAGTFFNAFHFQGHKNAIHPQKSDPKLVHANMYDASLLYQRATAQRIVNGLVAYQQHSKGMTANCDNKYPCVLLDFGMPSEVGPKRGWVNFLTILFVAIMDKMAYDAGLNIEIVRRSSFSQMRVSVSDCEPCLRISVGLIPSQYADLIVQGIVVLNYIINHPGPRSWFKQDINMVALREGLIKYNKKGASNVVAKDNMWDMLWAPCDAKKKSGMTQIGRSEETVESIIDEILYQLIESKKSINEICLKQDLFQKCFVRPFGEVLESFRVNDNKVQVRYSKSIRNFKWALKPIPISSDTYYINHVSLYLSAFTADNALIADILKDENRDSFYIRAEKLATESVFSPDEDIVAEDGYGSDSDLEYEIDEEKRKERIYAKKLICATGLRAIQLAFYAIKYVKSEELNKNCFGSEALTESMYYETSTALKDVHNIRPPFSVLEKYKNQSNRLKITFYDLNYANTQNAPKIESFDVSSGFIVLDITSSTISEINANVDHYLKYTRAVILVSSGLKNEQAMTDRNHYGTVRIFSKEKPLRDALIAAMKEAESRCFVRNNITAGSQPALMAYQHPKESHMLRISAKRRGWLPTNEKIAFADQEEAEGSKRSLSKKK